MTKKAHCALAYVPTAELQLRCKNARGLSNGNDGDGAVHVNRSTVPVDSLCLRKRNGCRRATGTRCDLKSHGRKSPVPNWGFIKTPDYASNNARSWYTAGY